MQIIKHLIRSILLILIMGILYYGIEVLWRGYSYWEMILIGGMSAYLIGLLDEGKTTFTRNPCLLNV